MPVPVLVIGLPSEPLEATTTPATTAPAAIAPAVRPPTAPPVVAPPVAVPASVSAALTDTEAVSYTHLTLPTTPYV